MEKKIAGLLGAVATLGALSTAQAAPAPGARQMPLQANSYADLLEPIPNAAALLQAVDESSAGYNRPTQMSSSRSIIITITIITTITAIAAMGRSS